MSNTAEIEQKLLTYISSELAAGKSDLERETNLADVIDSTAIMELVVWIEDNFGFQVDLDDIDPEQFGSVAKLASYIDSRKS
ncbi:MAG: acyl carrier protein [Deltaproteobacteria bacterium]